MIYVCDHCGLLHHQEAVPEGEEWNCAGCGGNAAWEFPNAARRNAEHHAAHIERGRDSRLFRRVPRVRL